MISPTLVCMGDLPSATIFFKQSTKSSIFENATTTITLYIYFSTFSIFFFNKFINMNLLMLAKLPLSVTIPAI